MYIPVQLIVLESKRQKSPNVIMDRAALRRHNQALLG